MTVERAREVLGDDGVRLSAREIETAIEQVERLARLMLDYLRSDQSPAGRRQERAS